MRFLLISIPIDENLKFALFAIGQRFEEIAKASHNLDISDPVFGKIHFPHFIKFTEDKPDPWEATESGNTANFSEVTKCENL